MGYISECLKQLETLIERNSIKELIKINVYLAPIINEDINQYDEHALEEWYDFAGTIEGIIENFCEVVNISLSKNPNSLSEYIDFYSYDENGNKKEYLIDLRLSDHDQTISSKEIRKKHANKIDSNYRLKTIIVNGKMFKTYHEAITYLRKFLCELLVNCEKG